MSYHQDLDEIPSKTLRQELSRRKAARMVGLCDYCGRMRGITPSCKFSRRHNLKFKPIELTLTCVHYSSPEVACSRCTRKNCAACSLCLNCQPKKVKS